jgi:hypothetical protein
VHVSVTVKVPALPHSLDQMQDTFKQALTAPSQ